jgi:hypothetical protein
VHTQDLGETSKEKHSAGHGDASLYLKPVIPALRRLKQEDQENDVFDIL